MNHEESRVVKQLIILTNTTAIPTSKRNSKVTPVN